ncbi:MAG: sulfatase, partial [Planctomycetota bacterium]
MKNFAICISLASVAVFAASLACATAAETKTAASARPNIILFLIDDQNVESIGAFGGNTWTPNLDRMAREGMRFTEAHVSSTVCTPSRYTFLTGRYAGTSTSKLYDDACGGAGMQGHPNFNMALERDRMNVGNVLREAGYTTGFVGKFHLGSPLDFPEFYEGEDALREVPRNLRPGPEAQNLISHNERVMRRYLQALGFSWAKHIYPENMQRPFNEHNPEWTVEAALEFIEQSKDRPFYLHCCTTLLHGGEGSWRKSMDYPLISGEGELKELPKVMTPREELLKTLAEKGFDPSSPTAGEAWIDDALGAVFAKLKELGIDENTLVLFAPDHGRDGKAALFAHNGTRVPMIARWPKGITAGLVCDELVQNIDWVPTALDVAGVTSPKEYRIDGRSLAPLFDDGEAEPWRDYLYFEMGDARAVMTKDWKYIAVRYPAEKVEAIRRATVDGLPRLMAYIGRLGIGIRGADNPNFWDADQLYDLRRDPREKSNLARDPKCADQLAALRGLLTESVKCVGRPFGEFVPGKNTAPSGSWDDQIA